MTRFKFLSVLAASVALIGLLWTVSDPQTTRTFVTEDLAQTLTNKTFNLLNNTLLGTTAQFNTAVTDGDFITTTGIETLSNKTLATPVISGAAPATPVANTLYTDSALKAWAFITFSAGVPSITDDFNVSSITDNGVGDVTLTFATALSNGTYPWSGADTGGANTFLRIQTQVATSLRYWW